MSFKCLFSETKQINNYLDESLGEGRYLKSFTEQVMEINSTQLITNLMYNTLCLVYFIILFK